MTPFPPRPLSAIVSQLVFICLFVYHFVVKPHRSVSYSDSDLLLHTEYSVVDLSLLVTLGEPCKNGWTNRDAVWRADLCDPSNDVVKAFFRGRIRGRCRTAVAEAVKSGNEARRTRPVSPLFGRDLSDLCTGRGSNPEEEAMWMETGVSKNRNTKKTKCTRDVKLVNCTMIMSVIYNNWDRELICHMH